MLNSNFPSVETLKLILGKNAMTETKIALMAVAPYVKLKKDLNAQKMAIAIIFVETGSLLLGRPVILVTGIHAQQIVRQLMKITIVKLTKT